MWALRSIIGKAGLRLWGWGGDRMGSMVDVTLVQLAACTQGPVGARVQPDISARHFAK